MDHIFLCQVIQSLEDIFDYWLCFVLIEVSLFPESRLEVAFIAQLGNYITVPVASEDLMAFEDIGVIEFFEDINLREK